MASVFVVEIEPGAGGDRAALKQKPVSVAKYVGVGLGFDPEAVQETDKGAGVFVFNAVFAGEQALGQLKSGGGLIQAHAQNAAVFDHRVQVLANRLVDGVNDAAAVPIDALAQGFADGTDGIPGIVGPDGGHGTGQPMNAQDQAGIGVALVTGQAHRKNQGIQGKGGIGIAQSDVLAAGQNLKYKGGAGPSKGGVVEFAQQKGTGQLTLQGIFEDGPAHQAHAVGEGEVSVLVG